MTDVKKLLDATPPLPWRFDFADGLQAADDYPVASIGSEADAALIVHAVNHLPDYEAAVDALDLMVHHFSPKVVENAIAVLRRLRPTGSEKPEVHAKQSLNGCVTRSRKWSDHTAAERGRGEG